MGLFQPQSNAAPAAAATTTAAAPAAAPAADNNVVGLVEAVDKGDIKTYTNDMTPEFKVKVKERLFKIIDDLLKEPVLSCMAVAHLGCVSPTSIKSRGKNTSSITEILKGVFEGTRSAPSAKITADNLMSILDTLSPEMLAALKARLG